MKQKLKYKWLVSTLVVLSAASLAAVAVSCTPKNNPNKRSNPTNPTKNQTDNDQTKNDSKDKV
ncbi:hypothetical protein JM47_03715 [Ureaplasma diversum]|uniref:Lipoprotein n=1 Tax=Ureaplasma diversum TaxID=42094 RepID=A0A0C5S2I2_9BACT|nr:hypothetical protein [Ureaplasma diversum]AJQ45630.1 hypothetical protein JM47_03715 [Ureaplasma diversum]